MAKTLLEQLPEIVANGRKEAERILESIEGRHRVSLQTREWVLPAKDSAVQDWIRASSRQAHLEGAGNVGADLSAQGRMNSPLHNRLIYGDNLLAMAALLAGDEQTPSLRGKVDLIYIDPPFDSKADYRTNKVILPSPARGGGAGGEGSVELEQKPTVIEQFAYSDTWSDGTASYLAMITPRLILMRELLSDSGSTGTGKTWVLQALLIWQLLNKTAALAEGIDDQHAAPRVIVSVLMLREGFDVNNICVIVPLRSSQAQILLEQTIGRGLRLMWRDEEYTDLKRENRERINTGLEPGNLIDILSIVEHPAFQSFYDELMAEGLAGVTTEEMDSTSSTGDVIAVELRDGFEQYDFAIPFILREAESFLEHHALDLMALPAFTAMTLDQLTALLGKGDTFVSQDLQSSTLFGDYRVEGVVMNVSGYNDFLARLTRRISQALSQPLPKGNKIATHLANPYLQTNTAELTGWLDGYIRHYLFGAAFDPMPSDQTQAENWRVLLLQPVIDHISKVFAVALIESEHQDVVGETEVHYRNLSEVPKLMMRESNSLPVAKCIYERLPFPARNGGLERAFIEWAQADSQIHAFCKVSETRHDFVRLRYVKEDGLPAFYSPDFLVRTEDAIYLVETKAQGQVTTPNVQRKLKAAVAWCDRINGLDEKQRGGLPWHYVLLGESLFQDWRSKGARLGDLLNFARVRPLADASTQERLGF